MADDGSDVEVDGMPPMYESSNDSDEEPASDAKQGTELSARRKMSTVNQASVNFTRLSRHNMVFQAGSARRLKQLNGNTSLSDLAPCSTQLGGLVSLTVPGIEAVGLRSRKT